MMPKMNGMEATKIIRDLGYTQPIVALTANALVGQAELFLANGFDGFLSKPIDLRQLDATLHKLIRDKQPRKVIEALRRRKEERESGNSVQPPKKPNIIGIFAKDADKAASAMEAIASHNFRRDTDIQAFVVHAHSMKTALAYINEMELSEAAKVLEQAGREKDIDVLVEKTPEFVTALREIIQKNEPMYETDNGTEYEEDHALLQEKLAVMRAACLEYDSGTIRDALSELNGKKWHRPTKELLDTIAEHLLLSNYEEIESAVGKVLNDE